MTASNLLKGKITEKGFTQHEIADKMGISRTTFSYKINNKRPFTVSEIKKLTIILEIQDKDAYFFN